MTVSVLQQLHLRSSKLIVMAVIGHPVGRVALALVKAVFKDV